MTGDDTQVFVLAAQQRRDHEQIIDHEGRLRLVEAAVLALGALPDLVRDLEGRQRADERFRYALPLALVAAAFSAAAAVVTAVMTVLGEGA